MGTLVLAVVWLGFAAWAALLAREKGRYWVGWAFAGVLLGPVVVLVAVLVPSPRVVCPHCGSRIPLGASVCRYCGRDV